MKRRRSLDLLTYGSKALSFVLLFGTGLHIAGEAQAQRGVHFATVREWNIAIYSPDPRRGNFQYCAATNPDGNLRVTVGWPNSTGEAIVGIEFDSKDSARPGESIPVRYWFNDGEPISKTAVIIDDRDLTRGRIEEDPGPGSDDQLRNARVMYVEIGSGRWTFSLRGSNAAVSSVFDCARSLIANAPPQAATPAPPSPQAPPPSALVIRNRFDGDCGQPYNSIQSSTPVRITLVNRSGSTVGVVWRDFNGGSREYRRLRPGESYQQSTFTNHAWQFAGPRGCSPLFVPPDNATYIIED